MVIPKPSACSPCPLFAKNPRGLVHLDPAGVPPSADPRITIVGEAGGKHEHFDGLPFRPFAEAGSVLEQVFTRTGHPREQHSLMNMVNCQPPKNFLEGAPWEAAAIDHCRVHRDAWIKKQRPRVLVALGNIPLRVLTGMQGRKQNVGLLRGFALPSSEYYHTLKGEVLTAEEALQHDGPVSPVPVVASFHPQFIRRGATQFYPVLYVDLLTAHGLAAQVASCHARGEHYQFAGPEKMAGYRTVTSLEQLHYIRRQLEENRDLWLTYDIETLKSAGEMEDEIQRDATDTVIRSVQFSTAIGEGWYVDWHPELLDGVKSTFATPNRKAGFNSYLFDDPILLASGTGLKINGERHDLMTAWHHLQPDLDANLQFTSSFYGMPFPWKHLSATAPDVYGCADVDAPQRILAKVFDQMDKAGVRRGYDRHIVRLRQEVLAPMEARGIHVDAKQLSATGEDLVTNRDRIFEELQGQIPNHIQRLHRYKRLPAKLKEVLAAAGEDHKDPKWFDPEGQREALRMLRAADPTPTVPGDSKERCGEWILSRPSADEPPQFCIRKPFLPGSSAQILDYIRAAGHKVPKDFKSGDETTAKRELERLSTTTKDPVYKLILEFRQMDKMYSTYVLGWMPGKDSRVHTTFTFRPATGQLSSRDPNAQNSPKHGDTAKAWNAALTAPPGRVLVEIDFSAFHVLTTGFEAKDKLLMRLARIDPHSFVASYFKDVDFPPINPDLSDDEIAELTAQVKKGWKFQRNKQAKPGILGYGFGLGPNNFFNLNRESFASLKAVKELFHLLDELFPKASKWRDEVRREAFKHGRLVTRHGYQRHFGEVYRKERGQYKPGNDSEKAIAFRPANDAFGHIKDNMLEITERGWADRYQMVNTVHDSIWFYPLIQDVEECIWNVTEVMTAPSKILIDPDVAPEGLWCGVEVEIGFNRRDMATVLATNHRRERLWVAEKDVKGVLEDLRKS